MRRLLKRIVHFFTACDSELLTEVEGSDMLMCSCGKLVTPAEAFIWSIGDGQAT